MNTSSEPTDLFSRFVNWISEAGKDKPATNQAKEGQDFFSRFMNRISN